MSLVICFETKATLADKSKARGVTSSQDLTSVSGYKMGIINSSHYVPLKPREEGNTCEVLDQCLAYIERSVNVSYLSHNNPVLPAEVETLPSSLRRTNGGVESPDEFSGRQA